MKNEPASISIFWFRRDLRFHDNAALLAALRGPAPVQPLFIFDTDILDKLPSKDDRRVDFIHQALQALQSELLAHGSTIMVRIGRPLEVFHTLSGELNVKEVHANEDYEPYAIERDAAVSGFLTSKGIGFHLYKDQVVFAKNDFLKSDNTPYTVFTPYARRWMMQLQATPAPDYPSEKYLDRLLRRAPEEFPSLELVGFRRTDINFTQPVIPGRELSDYGRLRDLPFADATSRLGIHLRFGTVSIRKLVNAALQHSEVFLKELIWREFYMTILWHFPHVVSHAFKREYDNIKWRNVESEFENWCKGVTGFPLVDAGMRQLNATGFMHNRLRMLTASFLCKHLLIDWRWGEAYFATHLNDFELSSNNGGWQWAAGTGCDAAPYFRIFSPSEQLKKFDPDLSFVKKWVPEFGSAKYPSPMVDHSQARVRALDTYKRALAENKT